MFLRRLFIGVTLISASSLWQGCSTFDDMTTYFNIYYNADRIMKEVEEVPDNADGQNNGMTLAQQQQKAQGAKTVKIPEYYDELIRNPNFDVARKVISGTVQQRGNAAQQTVKLDSVLTKCTKILKFHSNSSYVPDALYMLAKAFYLKGKQTDFLYSRQKAEEFIQLFPESALYADAHLLLAEDLIALKENVEAARALSRCVDVALPRKRYDIVTKSLRYTADIALQRNDLEGAVRPYLNAMLLSHNGEANATWQLEVGSLELITGHNEDAAQAFRDVAKYEPDLYTEFASQFGLGIALRQMKQYDAAKKQLEYVRDKPGYSPWKPYAEMELATNRWVRGETPEAADEYRRIDTANKTTEVSTRATFEWAMRALLAGDYGTAKGKFEVARASMVSYSKEAERLYNVLVVGDAASRDMIALEARMAGPDTGAAVPPPAERRGIDTVRLAQNVPIISIEHGPVGPPHIVDTVKIDTSMSLAMRDSIVAAKRTRDSAAAVAIAVRKQKSRDSTRNALATSYYDVARMYFLLGHEDSMVAYYLRVIALKAPGDISATALYSYALYLREQGRDPATVDTCMQLIVDQFPKSKFAPMARLHLGLTDEEIVDSSETEYTSGERFMEIRNDSIAILHFLHVQSHWPKSDYAPQSLYAVGWIFEYNIVRYDSAKVYYELLVKLYPNSEYAKRARVILAMVTPDTTHKDSTGHAAGPPSLVPATPAAPTMSAAPGPIPTTDVTPPSRSGDPLRSGPGEDMNRGHFPRGIQPRTPILPPLPPPDTSKTKIQGPQ